MGKIKKKVKREEIRRKRIKKKDETINKKKWGVGVSDGVKRQIKISTGGKKDKNNLHCGRKCEQIRWRKRVKFIGTENKVQVSKNDWITKEKETLLS